MLAGVVAVLGSGADAGGLVVVVDNSMVWAGILVWIVVGSEVEAGMWAEVVVEVCSGVWLELLLGVVVEVG